MTGGEMWEPGPRWWRRLMLVAAWLAIPVMGVLYTNYVQRESDHRWCELLVVLTTPRPDVPPPTTERGIKTAQILERMKGDFDC